jgi:2'-hydroxyisoflavone reductase
MRILVLGGTVFLGRAFVDAALAAGHEPTLFTRGRRNPDLYPDVEKLRGDRDGDLGALRGREWDAVVDTSGYVPRVVREGAELLRAAAPHYQFVSSISASADFSTPGLNEDTPVAELEDPATEAVEENYGALKVACERVVQEVYGDGALIVRPGLIVGPHDPTDRFTYWPRRIAAGGDVLVPNPPERGIQFVDVRDLAEWMLRLAEQRTGGVYNATGPAEPLTMERFVEESRAVAGSDARFVWVDADFLVEQGVGPWMELPLWIPGDEYAGFMETDVSRAVAAGLTFRPLAETIRATLDWDRARPDEEKGVFRSSAAAETSVGLRPERERELLAAWA